MELKYNDYKNLRIWENSMDIAVDIYEITKAYPEEEKFGLTAQMRRSSVSIPSNIAEGHGRYHKKDFAHFVRNSIGSASELETQLILSKRVGLLDNNICDAMCERINQDIKMMISFINTLR